MNDVIKAVRRELNNNADEKTRISGKRYFKEEIRLYGVKSAQVEKISKNIFGELSDKSKSVVFKMCEEFLQSGFMEESFVACHWSYFVHKQFVAEDFGIFDNWVSKYVTNWATCDTLCNHTVGSLVEQFPDCLVGLKRWARSENRWMRRASAVSLIIPAKRGKFLNDIFEIADQLLTDRDDMVQKGYGWMLKSAGAAHEKEVFDFVMKRKDTMPRTSLRYAIEKMPAELKAKAMER